MLQTPSFYASTRRPQLIAWAALAAIPVIYIALVVITASRNIVFWDEFDTALDLILRINAGADWSELMQRFFAINNEHRMVTSRLMFAGSYWLTGTVNFHVIGAIGNLFLVGACVALVVAMKSWEQRVRMGVVLAFVMFQLEHFENFIWSGASIDHFQVVMLAVCALAALARGSRAALLGGAVFGLLGTFTLAHGSMIWPIGALLLWHQRRWRHLAGWCTAAVVAVALFLYGFELNNGHRIADLSLAHVFNIARYWFALLGAPVAFGDAIYAAVPGVVLLGALALLAARGAATRHSLAFFTALFALGSLALVAFGRSEIAGAQINSRYMVLGALAWAMVVFMLLERTSSPQRPFVSLLCVLPLLVGFNIIANRTFAPMVETFVEIRDRAATRFKLYGEDGRGIASLHPRKGHADALLKTAYERGVYRLPRVSHETEFDILTPSTRIVTYVDENIATSRAVTLGGWAMLPGVVSKRGQVYVVLKSERTTLYFSTLTLQRPDIAKYYKQPGWRLSGFRAVIGRNRLPAENFQVGIIVKNGDTAEFMMTENRLNLVDAPAPAAPAALARATGQ